METRWGWQAHRYINNHAVDYLPDGMSFFLDHREFLDDHATDPDGDSNPGFYHYIDIDFYPEFEAGNFPNQLDSAIALYGISTLEYNGTVPWIIDQWTDSLTVLMSNSDWANVWQIAAELGHYIADSHQPLHLTLNFNGQLTDNWGIHSRYESSMVNANIDELTLPTGSGVYWDSVIDSTFRYIGNLYPFVELIMVADDLGVGQDSDYGSTYYNVMWTELDSITIISINSAIIDLASVWLTAWENAGRPNPNVISVDEENYYGAERYELGRNYPNPFNPITTIDYSLPEQTQLKISVYDLSGKEVDVLFDGFQEAGIHEVFWNASNVSSGIYFYRLQAGDFVQTRKMVLLK
ncbi:T9SS type A sorting domain-containing protein [Candidatus Marinimicrobia bacterium MT.SAG.4]|nr:T9SS type A sorting domain-containing protein [Candidatus Marinimicrobia bacterium MT.SAG.4]